MPEKLLCEPLAVVSDLKIVAGIYVIRTLEDLRSKLNEHTKNK